MVDNNDDPETFQEAMNRDDCDEWMEGSYSINSGIQFSKLEVSVQPEIDV